MSIPISYYGALVGVGSGGPERQSEVRKGQSRGPEVGNAGSSAAGLRCPNMRQLKYASIAAYPGHLYRQIRRCLVSYSTATTKQLVEWAYGDGSIGKSYANWQYWNVRRCCRQWGIKVVGTCGRNLLWSL